MLTDAETRAELERINILYPSLFGIAKTYLPPDDQVWVDIFRLLAEKHKALRDLIKCVDCREGICSRHWDTFKNACKEE